MFPTVSKCYQLEMVQVVGEESVTAEIGVELLRVEPLSQDLYRRCNFQLLLCSHLLVQKGFHSKACDNRAAHRAQHDRLELEFSSSVHTSGRVDASPSQGRSLSLQKILSFHSEDTSWVLL